MHWVHLSCVLIGIFYFFLKKNKKTHKECGYLMSFEKKYYIRFPINEKLILEILKKNKKEKINFFIDLNSICKGFYKPETVLYEIGEYIERGEVSRQLLHELKNWLNSLYVSFKEFDPFFILFYDDGKCLQNRLVMNTYKNGRSIHNLIIDDDTKTTELFRKIRKWYYLKIKEEFEKTDVSSVQYIPDYETDVVPHYCIQYNVFDSSDKNVLNVILSVDKDLLQTCEFSNTIMCATSFRNNKNIGKFEIDLRIFNKNNAISYIYSKFSVGILTAKYIPLILALSGDKSDEIPGVSGIGVSKAIKILTENKIPYNPLNFQANFKELPEIIKKNINVILRNYKLISFEEQIKRLPRNFLV